MLADQFQQPNLAGPEPRFGAKIDAERQLRRARFKLRREVGAGAERQTADAHTSRDCSTAARMNDANSGCGANGRERSSGWNCTPMNHGCVGDLHDLRQQPVRRHAGEQQAAALQRAEVVVVDLVAVAVPFADPRGREDVLRPGSAASARTRRRRAAWCRRDRRPPRAARRGCRASTRSSCRPPVPRTGRIRSTPRRECRPDAAPPRPPPSACRSRCRSRGRRARGRSVPPRSCPRRRARRSRPAPGCRARSPAARRCRRSRTRRQSIHSTLTRTLLAMPPWASASASDL